MILTISIIVILLLVVLAWWLLIESEGVYLGKRVVIFLYDLYARRYDNIKQFEPEFEQWLIAKPLLGLIEPLTSPLVLDVATGTGRVPLALLNNPVFQGRVIGMDLSRKMLGIAAEKLSDQMNRVSLIWGPAEDLPFPDDVFDVVTCLESLEFMSNPEKALEEMIRVLRPGGVLLISNRINTRWMPGRLWSEEELCEMIYHFGIDEMQIEPWQVDYSKLWGRKEGFSDPTGAISLQEILYCPRCPDHPLIERNGEWFCTHCKAWTKTAPDGVIELAPLYTHEKHS